MANVDTSTIPRDPYTPMTRHIPRIELEITLHRGRNWLLETYTALGEAALDAPATQDEHDPDVWWTPKDHFAHSSRVISTTVAGVRNEVLGDDLHVLLDHGVQLPDVEGLDGRGELTPETFPAILASINRMTHEIWLENHERSMSEIVAMGQRAFGDLLRLIGELDDEQLDARSHLGGYTVAQAMLITAGHDRIHLRWALDGLAERAASAVEA